MCLALRASGLWLRYATLQNLIPSFPWITPLTRPPPWRNLRKGRDQILPSGNLGSYSQSYLTERPVALLVVSVVSERVATVGAGEAFGVEVLVKGRDALVQDGLVAPAAPRREEVL